MTDKGVVYDLGYVPYEGERRARRGAIATTYRDGIYRVFGIRRRARKKILPWMPRRTRDAARDRVRRVCVPPVDILTRGRLTVRRPR